MSVADTGNVNAVDRLTVKLATTRVPVATHLRGTPRGVTRVKAYTRKQYTVRAFLTFQEIEHEGDLEREWNDVGPVARKHGIRLISWQALQNVSEDGDPPFDDFYEGGGRYEQGVMTVEGERASMKAFLKELDKGGGMGTYGGVARAEWVGKAPPRPRITTKPSERRGYDGSKHVDVFGGKTKIAELTYYPAEGGSYLSGPKPVRWVLNWDWGANFSGQYTAWHPTQERAIAEIKKLWRPSPKL